MFVKEMRSSEGNFRSGVGDLGRPLTAKEVYSAARILVFPTLGGVELERIAIEAMINGIPAVVTSAVLYLRSWVVEDSSLRFRTAV